MIVGLEGSPGAGKTTLSTRLLVETDILSIPEVVVEIFDETNELAFVYNDEVKSEAASNADVAILDRSFLSTLAFNFAHDATTGSSNYELIRDAVSERIADGRILVPDSYIYLDVPPQVSLDRQSPGNYELWRDPEIIRWTSLYFKHFLTNHFDENSLLVIDARQNANNVYEEAIDFISRVKEGA